MTITLKTAITTACFSTILLAGPGAKADNALLSVAVDVAGVCKFSDTSYFMAFSNVDPSLKKDATAKATIAYQCTNGTKATSVQVNAKDSPTNLLLQDPANSSYTLPVQLTWTTPSATGTGFGAGNDIAFDVTGTVLASDLGKAVATSYRTRAALTVSP